MERPICSQTCLKGITDGGKRRNKQELLFCEEWPVLGLHLLKTTALLRYNTPIIHFTLLKIYNSTAFSIVIEW